MTGSNDMQGSMWSKIANKRIYFAHQSVGFNIIDGVNDLIGENPAARLKIAETIDHNSFKEPIFAHSRVGKNQSPETKVDGFVKNIEQGIGDNADYAFLKLCYVDITADTDYEKLFGYYERALAKLKESYGTTTFIHITIPVTKIQSGLKGIIKRMVGKSIGYEDNYKRHLFNQMLRDRYNGKEPLFDLAMEESGAAGEQAVYSLNGEKFHTLAPDYTDDGGHLNVVGRRVIAKRLLRFIAELPLRNNSE